MRLAPGTRLGPYEILTPLGAGGMGEVYRARDTKLNRDVALKILPDAFAQDSDRVARFKREAQVLASLNHPNIGGIHGLEESSGITALVLELVEGPTLADRIAQGPIAIVEALPIAKQIAEALEAAHEQGIIHRDLKPANIKIRSDGTVKVLDFGLAKALGSDRPGAPAGLTNSPTITSPAMITGLGIILGTAAYMSPEQATGRPADKRSDNWAFGCVLYEILTGQRAFGGDDVPEAIASVLKSEPRWELLGATTPAAVRRLIRRCLEKNPRRRLHDIADARVEIEQLLEASAEETAIDVKPPAQRLRTALWTMSGLVAGGLITGFALYQTRSSAPTSVMRFTIAMQPKIEVGEAMALSPDGRTLVFAGTDDAGSRLFKRSLDTLEFVPIRGSEGASLPFFSPDGESVGFWVGRTLKRVPLQGGAAAAVTEASGSQGAGTWLSDDTIVFGSSGRGLARVPAGGGEAREITVVDREHGELEHRWPVAVPGDRAVAFTIHYGSRDTQRIDVVSLESGERKSLVQGNGVRVLPTGHIVFQRAGSLWAAPFDPTGLTLTGAPIAVVEGVKITSDWSPMMTVATNGSLAYATGSDPYPPRTLVWVDRTGRETVIDAPPRAWYWPQVSPDGKRLGFHIMDPGNMDAWIYELDHGPLQRVTYDPRQDGYPVWTPDGKYVAFWSRQDGNAANLYLRSADLTGSDQRLTTDPNVTFQHPFSWAGDGKLLVFQQHSQPSDTRLDIGVLALEGDRTPKLLIQGPSDEGHPAVSPDGRWIAYHSNFSGPWQVYVQPFPDLGSRWQVSTEGGVSPLWHPNGRELFYRNGQVVMSVPVSATGGTFKYGNSRVLFEGSYVRDELDPSSGRSYALAPDGERFLMMKEAVQPATQIFLVLNWTEELKRLVPTK